MINKGIATLSLALLMSFLLLSHFDSNFFLIHFYESAIYLAIVVMLFYFEDRWAYMLGMLAPAAWLVLFTVVGGLETNVRQLFRGLYFERPDFAANALATITLILSIAMIVVCARRWRHEFAGDGKGWRTFATCLGVVAVYYGAMAVWILRWPAAVA